MPALPLNSSATGTYPLQNSLTITSGGLLAFGGNTLNGGQIVAPATSLFVWTPTAGTTLTIDSTIVGTGGVTKDGAGTAVLGVRQGYSGTTFVNDGTLQLDTTNAIFVSGLGAAQSLTVNGGSTTGTGGTFDLNGYNQVVNVLSSGTTDAPNTGGTVTNSSAARTSTLTSVGGGTFAGVITGNLNFVRSGNNTTTLLSNNTYNGATIIRGGTLTLQMNGALSGTTSVTNYYGTLNLDNTNNPLNDVANRLGTTTPITLWGGTLNYLGYQGYASAETLGAITLQQGMSTISSTRGAGGQATLTLSGLNWNSGSAVNFTATSGTLGAYGTGNSQILLNNLNGSAFSQASLVNNIIGGWAVVNGDSFATYLNPGSGVIGQGIGELGVNTAWGFAGFDGSDLTGNNNTLPSLATATWNISDTTAARTLTMNRTINSLRLGRRPRRRSPWAAPAPRT